MSTSAHHALIAVALVTWSTAAIAQQPGTNVQTQPPAPAPTTPASATDSPSMTVTATPGPGPMVSDPNEPVIDASTTRNTFLNRPLFVTGLVLLGGSYG